MELIDENDSALSWRVVVLQEIFMKRRNERCITGEKNSQAFNPSYSDILIICFSETDYKIVHILGSNMDFLSPPVFSIVTSSFSIIVELSAFNSLIVQHVLQLHQFSACIYTKTLRRQVPLGHTLQSPGCAQCQDGAARCS